MFDFGEPYWERRKIASPCFGRDHTRVGCMCKKVFPKGLPLIGLHVAL